MRSGAPRRSRVPADVVRQGLAVQAAAAGDPQRLLPTLCPTAAYVWFIRNSVSEGGLLLPWGSLEGPQSVSTGLYIFRFYKSSRVLAAIG